MVNLNVTFKLVSSTTSSNIHSGKIPLIKLVQQFLGLNLKIAKMMVEESIVSSSTSEKLSNDKTFYHHTTVYCICVNYKSARKIAKALVNSFRDLGLESSVAVTVNITETF